MLVLESSNIGHKHQFNDFLIKQNASDPIITWKKSNAPQKFSVTSVCQSVVVSQIVWLQYGKTSTPQYQAVFNKQPSLDTPIMYRWHHQTKELLDSKSQQM